MVVEGENNFYLVCFFLVLDYENRVVCVVVIWGGYVCIYFLFGFGVFLWDSFFKDSWEINFVCNV